MTRITPKNNPAPGSISSKKTRWLWAAGIACLLCLFCGAETSDLIWGDDLIGIFRGIVQVSFGSVADGVYTAKEGNFSCRFPFANNPGEVIEDFSSLVGTEARYSNHTGTFLSVSYIKYQPGVLPVDGSMTGPNWFLDYNLDNHWEWIRRIIPESLKIHQEYLEQDTLIHFGVFTLPEGSRMAKGVDGKQLDAFEGVFVFIRGDYGYGLSTEVTPQLVKPGERKIPDDQMVDHLRSLLQEFYDSCDFSP